MPLLTIVIPVYNAENYLKPCLDSVAAQEFTDYELVLVDDGSQDGSGRICDEYAVRDPRIRVIHQSNGGQAAARNRGIDVAVGDYVGFCDNDDILHPSIFRVLLENAGAAGADISACSYNERDMRGKVSHDRHSGETLYLSNREGMEQFLSREKMDIYVWTKIYRRTFLETHGIRFEQGRNDEDFLFNYAAFRRAGQTVFTDRALYTYNVRDDSECRMFYKKDLRRYLHNTLYRTYKIESGIRREYPELLSLAKRQTIRYHIMMIGRIIQTGYRLSEPYFSYMMRYLRENRRQVIAQRNYWGMSRLGISLLLLLPPRWYCFYRRILEKVRK